MGEQKVFEKVRRTSSTKELGSIFGGSHEPIESSNHDWFLAALWDDGALLEFEQHQEFGNLLHTKMFLGRLLSNCLVEKRQNVFGMLDQMDWKQSFILIDIVDDKPGTCGSKPCIRVQETPTWNNNNSECGSSKKPKMWDLIIFPECTELATEMIRLPTHSVRTTVAIWNCGTVDRYRKAWIDDNGQEIFGEIFLKASTAPGKVLSAIIFHHEMVAEARYPQLNYQVSNQGEIMIRTEFNFQAGRDGGADHLAVFMAKSSRKAKTCLSMQISDVEPDCIVSEEDKVDDSTIADGEDMGEFVPRTDPVSWTSGFSVDVLAEVDAQLYRMVNKMLGSVNTIE